MFSPSSGITCFGLSTGVYVRSAGPQNILNVEVSKGTTVCQSCTGFVRIRTAHLQNAECYLYTFDWVKKARVFF